MLATSERVSPCRARCSARSVGRVMSSVPSSSRTSMARALRSARSPRGPATRTTSGSIVTVTPVGMGMGFLPMRLMMRLPDLGHDLAPDARLARIVAGHDALRSGDDRRAHAAQDLRDVLGVDVRPAPRAGYPLETGDDGRAVLSVLEADVDPVARGAALGGADLEPLDVALLAQDAGHLGLQARVRDDDVLVRGLDAVADPGQEVGDRVGHRHGYQLDFVMPGMKPWWASSRRQMRHSPNLRYTARERPQRRQRLCARVAYLGVRLDRTIMDVFAICS